jgi:uracil-DNA glycosylase
MKNKFGSEWYDLLRNYLSSKEFSKISDTLLAEYKKKTKIIPEYKSPLFFKIFKDLQPSKIKVVILGQDPYHDKGTYTGYAFDNANSSKLSASLRNILKEVERCYPENHNKIDYGYLDPWDLSRWVEQGVFLVNTALSVVEKTPGVHMGLWRPFTINWIKELSNNRDDIIWLLWGKQAQGYEKYISNSTHRVIKSGHPSPLNRNNPFIGSNCFVECNEDLVARNKKEIIW